MTPQTKYPTPPYPGFEQRKKKKLASVPVFAVILVCTMIGAYLIGSSHEPTETAVTTAAAPTVVPRRVPRDSVWENCHILPQAENQEYDEIVLTARVRNAGQPAECVKFRTGNMTFEYRFEWTSEPHCVIRESPRLTPEVFCPGKHEEHQKDGPSMFRFYTQAGQQPAEVPVTVKAWRQMRAAKSTTRK